MSTENKPLVSICCLVYNHEPYLRDCFEGFVKQKTSFPIEILVHDDASTDHSADIIREYTARYPDLFKPIYQIENQYSKGVKISFEYQYPRAQGKYIALCEGDDYWTDPNKLQMQVDWLEIHPDYTMCCSDADIETPDGILDWHRYEKDCNIPTEDMILGGGGFIQTPTIVYRKDLLINYPEECKKCHIGDFPLQLWASIKGKIHYFFSKKAVYRFNYTGSWTSSQKEKKIDSLIKGWLSEFSMLDKLDKLTNSKYQSSFINYKFKFLSYNIRSLRKKRKEITKIFHSHIKKFTILQKIELYLLRIHLDMFADFFSLLTKKKIKDAILLFPPLKKIILYIYSKKVLQHYE